MTYIILLEVVSEVSSQHRSKDQDMVLESSSLYVYKTWCWSLQVSMYTRHGVGVFKSICLQDMVLESSSLYVYDSKVQKLGSVHAQTSQHCYSSSMLEEPA